jgi:hypothetical protein
VSVLEALADLALLWIVIPLCWLVVMSSAFPSRSIHLEVTIYTGFSAPILVKMGKSSMYWGPLGLVGIEAELSESSERRA